jgi:hypothetical protein
MQSIHPSYRFCCRKISQMALNLSLKNSRFVVSYVFTRRWTAKLQWAWGMGVQRPVFSVNEPENSGVRSARARSAAKTL